MTRIPLPTSLLAALAALALLPGCASSGGSTAAPSTGSTPPAAAAPATPSAPAAQPSTSAQPQAETVTIESFEYEVPESVPAGARFRVTNEDDEAHTLTLGGGADVQVVVPKGGTVTVKAPSEAGSYPIVCDFHGGMTSELVVV